MQGINFREGGSSPNAKRSSAMVRASFTSKMNLPGLASLKPSNTLGSIDSSKEDSILYENKFEKILRADKRTDDEARILYEKIKEFNFFQKFTESFLEKLEDEAIIQICKKMRYEKCPAGQVVFREGDPSSGKVYIIYTGCVLVIVAKDANIYVRNETPKATTIIFDRRKMRRSSTLVDIQSLQTIQTIASLATINEDILDKDNQKDKDIDNDKDRGLERGKSMIMSDKNIHKNKLKSITKVHLALGSLKKDQFSFSLNELDELDESLDQKTSVDEISQEIQEKVKTLGVVKDKSHKGDIFGERALTANDRRGATILTNTECEFLVITSHDFKLVKDRYDKKKIQKQDFMLNFFPDMKNVNASSIKEGFFYNVRDDYYIMDTKITQEGSIGDTIYVIFSGFCEVSKKISISEPQAQLMFANKQTKSVRICEIGSGIFFGEEILFDTKSNEYEYTVKVTSASAHIYSIKKKLFLSRFPPGCVAGVKDLYDIKKKHHEMILKRLIDQKFSDMEIVQPLGNTNGFDHQTQDRVKPFSAGRGVRNDTQSGERDEDSFDLISSIPIYISPRKQSNPLVALREAHFKAVSSSYGNRPKTEAGPALKEQVSRIDFDTLADESSLKEVYYKLNNRNDLLHSSKKLDNYNDLKVLPRLKKFSTYELLKKRINAINEHDNNHQPKNKNDNEADSDNNNLNHILKSIDAIEPPAKPKSSVFSRLNAQGKKPGRTIYTTNQPKRSKDPIISVTNLTPAEGKAGSSILKTVAEEVKSTEESVVGTTTARSTPFDPTKLGMSLKQPLQQTQVIRSSKIRSLSWDKYFNEVITKFKHLEDIYKMDMDEYLKNINNFKINFGSKFDEGSTKRLRILQIQKGLLKYKPNYTGTIDVEKHYSSLVKKKKKKFEKKSLKFEQAKVMLSNVASARLKTEPTSPSFGFLRPEDSVSSNRVSTGDIKSYLAKVNTARISTKTSDSKIGSKSRLAVSDMLSECVCISTPGSSRSSVFSNIAGDVPFLFRRNLSPEELLKQKHERLKILTARSGLKSLTTEPTAETKVDIVYIKTDSTIY